MKKRSQIKLVVIAVLFVLFSITAQSFAGTPSFGDSSITTGQPDPGDIEPGDDLTPGQPDPGDIEPGDDVMTPGQPDPGDIEPGDDGRAPGQPDPGDINPGSGGTQAKTNILDKLMGAWSSLFKFFDNL